MNILKILIKKLLSFFITDIYVSNDVCVCGDKNCKRKVVETIEGRLYVENNLACGHIKGLLKRITLPQPQHNS